ncbi:oxidoreductase [Shimia sp.]|uniref:oxidoreductase n=1 Tax=Shimia sp. TaxID=1954381 RepID=UPI0032973E9E
MGYVNRAVLVSVLTCVSSLAVATENAVLTVSGNLPIAQEDGNIQFSLDELQAMGTVTFETTTPWTDGVQTFEGVPLAALVSALQLEYGFLEATAVNDYSVNFPVDEAMAEGPVVSFLRNGKPMSLRDKGPLWIVYPYDSDADYRTEIVYSRSIWQLDRIVVKE